MSMSRIHGFPPILGSEPCLLILGSMPSVASLEKQQYYGKPQNAFWKIMGELFGAGPAVPYEERAQILIDKGIAVWDVLASCVRPGSLDSAIEMSTAEVNPLAAMLAQEASLTHVIFNGRKAEEFFNKRVLADMKRTDIRYICLPSTSPAMASLRFPAKLERWQVVAEAVATGH